MDATLQSLRDQYVQLFNEGALESLALLLHPEAVYRWVGAGHEVQGRAGLLAMFRQGQEYYGGQSRLTVVAGTADQAIWWEPTAAGLAPRGLQVLRAADGLIREIADAHDAALVARALEDPSPT